MQVYQKLFSFLATGLGLTAGWLTPLAVLLAAASIAYAQEIVDGIQPTDATFTNGPIEIHEFVMTNELEETNVFVTNRQSGPAPQMNRLSPFTSTNQSGAFAATNLAISTNDNGQSQEESPSRRELEQRLRNSSASSPSSSASSSRTDYGAFKIILDRNIFNQNRYRGRPQYVRREESERRRTEAFSLVGTMSYEKGVYAFFDGTSSEYRKTVKADEEIAGYKVTEIGYNCVKLVANATNQVQLPIGMQMSREELGEWSLGPQTASYGSSSSGGFGSAGFSSRIPEWGNRRGGPDRESRQTSSTTFTSSFPSTDSARTTNAATSSSSSDSASGGDASEMLKKLMQRREQELNK